MIVLNYKQLDKATSGSGRVFSNAGKRRTGLRSGSQPKAKERCVCRMGSLQGLATVSWLSLR